MKSRIVLSLLIILLSMPIIYSYGVTRPLPYELELLREEEGRFKFQVQVVLTENEKVCNYFVKEGFPLEVSFLQDSVTVFPGERKDVIGLINVPGSAGFGRYSGELCVSCVNSGNQEGTVVKQDVCGYPIKVDVVQTRSKDNMFIPVEQSPAINAAILLLGLIIFVVGLAIIIFISYKYKRKK